MFLHSGYAAITGVVCIVVLCCGLAHGHGTPHASPTPEQLAHLPPPIPGARDFYDELSTHGRTLVTESLSNDLATISSYYGVVDSLVAEEKGESTDVTYNRSLAEQALIQLVEKLPEAIVLDFRHGPPNHDPHSPIMVSGQASVLLLRIMTGEGDAAFRVQHVNLTSSGDGKPFVVHVNRATTTHLLLDLEEVPSGESTLLMAIQEDGNEKPTFWHGITVRQEPLGQLAVTILDETGASTPAFMRLVAQRNGKLWEPPNAVDLSPIMTSVTGLPIYGPGRGYTHYMPGAFRGPYWIVPGPFEMGLPPGEWEIVIHHGAEYTPIRDIVNVSEAAWTRKTYRLERWTNMPERGWWSGDDHVHAKLMSSEDADRLMAFVRAANINVANVLEMGNVDRTWYAQRGFGKAFRVQEGPHVLVPGQEDPRSAFGHSIGLNLTALARDLDHYMLTDLVADEIHRQGGLFGHTHVGEGGLGIHRDMTLLLPRNKSDFASIMQNILGTERYYDFLDLGFRLVASAGTDTPYGGAVGVVRCYAFLGEGAAFTADSWFDAFKRGRTFVTNGPMVELRVDDTYPGDAVLVNERRHLKVHARAWGLAGASAPARLEVVQCGSVIAEAGLDASNGQSAEIHTEIDSAFGFWLAARATGLDGSQAHTTPVYVVREGFRHWNVERAEGLIADRMHTLDEIDELVTEPEEKQRAGTLSNLDRWNGLMAQQAGQVRERTALARGLYEELRRVLEWERAARAGQKESPSP